MPGHYFEQGPGLGVREGKAGGLGDFSSGVRYDDPCLLFDRRTPPGIGCGHGGAAAEQPEQRVGDGSPAGSVAADEPAHHREAFPEPPSRDAHRRPAAVT